MKAVRLTIKNVGIIKDTVIELDKPLLLFYGDLAQGKTTILNAFKWCLGGASPTDIIRHGEKEASVLFEFLEDTGPGSISRSWYLNKENVVTARPVQFIRGGKLVQDVAKEIKKFLNPYLLDNEFLKKMSETERKAYFVQLFGVDTSAEDKEIDTAATEARTLRIKLSMYGEIDMTEVKPVDVSVLQSKKQALLFAHNEFIENTDKNNRIVRESNNAIDKKEERQVIITKEVANIEEEIKRLLVIKNDLSVEKATIIQFIGENLRQEEKPRPATPDTSELDNKISEAAAIAVKVEQYQRNLKRTEEKKADELKLSELEGKQRELKKQKTGKLAAMGARSGIDGLIFSEDGSFTFKDVSAGMLSTSQIMELSQELSALYPKGFGLDLIDRGESLFYGMKNVMEFVKKAQREEKTILASIVGERPAEVPLEVGVFVVDKGEVKS